MSKPERKSGKAVERSSFANRISRYLKEKGSLGDINLGMTGKLDVKGPEPSTTMVLGPLEMDMKQNGTVASKPSSRPSSADKTEIMDVAQLTIFYGGQVVVYDKFPSHKAKEIMELAKQRSSEALLPKAGSRPPPEKARPDSSPHPDLNAPSTEAIQPRQPQLADRIARRASLHRFFAKRKDRAAARAPYNVNSSPLPMLPKPEAPNLKVEGGQTSSKNHEKSNNEPDDRLMSNLELRL